MSVYSFFKRVLLGGLIFCMAIPAVSQSTLEPPKVRLVDKNHVNLISGTPNISLTTMTFGPPDMRLQHTISNYQGYFFGYHDNFMGAVYEVLLKPHPVTKNTATVMRVVSGDQTTDFDISGDTFTPIKDPQSSLVKQGDAYLFTDPSGTEYLYEFIAKGTAHQLTKTTYPNGFVVTRYMGGDIAGIATNTGLQFKYVFEGSGFLDESYPKKIIAINNAVEYCDPSKAPCDLDYEWPTSSYFWNVSSGSQIGHSLFRVTDPIGRVAEYQHTPFNLGQGDSTTPRIIDVKDEISGGPVNIKYDYENIYGWISGGGLFSTERC